MAIYRKKPVVIEAMPVAEVLADADRGFAISSPRWVREAVDDGVLIVLQEHVRIRTLEGTLYGEFHDWLIRGIRGGLYPCKPDIFAATYELVEA